MPPEKATLAVLTVGRGRGFVVRGPQHRLVVTAARCLPSLPPCSSFFNYVDVLAPLGAAPSVSAQCLFADPVADIAVLGMDDPDTYFGLVDEMAALEIANAKDSSGGFLLSLRNDWFGCCVSHHEGPYNLPLWIRDAKLPFIDGMSGSPILDEVGRAIGVVCVSEDNKNCTQGGGHPHLMETLPGWYLQAKREHQVKLDRENQRAKNAGKGWRNWWR
jgi:hypothetical protein